MGNKIGGISVISLILGVISFVLPSPYWLLAILFFSIGIIVPLTKKIWDVSGWASNKVEELK